MRHSYIDSYYSYIFLHRFVLFLYIPLYSYMFLHRFVLFPYIHIYSYKFLYIPIYSYIFLYIPIYLEFKWLIIPSFTSSYYTTNITAVALCTGRETGEDHLSYTSAHQTGNMYITTLRHMQLEICTVQHFGTSNWNMYSTTLRHIN